MRFGLVHRVMTDALAVLGILVLVLGGIGLGAWLGQPKYVPLFSGISAADAQAITDQLHSDNVPYQLTDGGATILVPQAQVYQERMKAAASFSTLLFMTSSIFSPIRTGWAAPVLVPGDIAATSAASRM